VPTTVQAEESYRCSPRHLLDVLTDQAFLTARGLRLAGTADLPTVDRNDDEVRLTIPRLLPVEEVPAPFRKLVGDGRVVQRDVWSLSEVPIRGHWVAETGRSSIELGGTMQISGLNGGSSYSVTARIAVGIPLLGRPAEKLAAPSLAELLATEQRFLTDWLSGSIERPS